MRFVENELYHVFNRGNRRQDIFFSEANYQFFIAKMKQHLKPACEILAWCLMPNHFHFVLYATEKSCAPHKRLGDAEVPFLSFQIGKLLSSYSQAINRQNNTTGSLFQQKTKVKPLTKDRKNDYYFLNAVHYCHQNPYKAKLVGRIEDWPYSSFPVYLGLRNDDLVNQDIFKQLTGYSKKEFYSDSYARIQELRF